MKKLLALLLALAMVACLFAGCAGDPEPSEDTPTPSSDTPSSEEPSSEPTGETYKIAMITDYGDITDQSFNQTTYEACKLSLIHI